MTSEPSITVGYTPQFKRDLKRLHKKYRSVDRDIETLIEQLQSGETPGDQVQGAGYTVYKVRLRSSDLARGKSGGYRAIYYIRTPERIILVTLYIKTEQSDINPDEIKRLIDELETPSE